MMTKAEKKQFARSLTKSILAELIAKIDSRIPDDWNGYELRQWLADKFQNETVRMDRSRKMKYSKEVASLSL